MTKEFADKVIKLYAQYAKYLSPKDRVKHNDILATFQELRDRGYRGQA